MNSCIKKQCIQYLKDKYSFDLNTINYLLEVENQELHIFQPEHLIEHYISDAKEKNDYSLLQKIINSGERTLLVLKYLEDYQVNGKNWLFHDLNKESNKIDLLKKFYCQHLKNDSFLPKHDIYTNDGFSEIITTLSIDSKIKNNVKETLFNEQILRINISPYKKHLSRNHIISIGRDDGFIALRFLSRNLDSLCYFDKNIKFNDIFVKDILRPINLLCSQIGNQTYTIAEVIIKFFIFDDGIEFSQPYLNLSSQKMGTMVVSTINEFDISTSYKSIEFQKFFKNLENKLGHAVEKPKAEEELIELIKTYKLLNY